MRVCFAENPNAAADAVIVGAEARPRVVSRPRFMHSRVGDQAALVRNEIAVVEDREAVASLHPLTQDRQQRVTGVHATEDGSRTERRRIGQCVAVKAPIGGMEIDEDVRIPGVEHHQRCARLRRFRLHVVAIEIEVLAICPHADQLGPVLLGTVHGLRRKSLVAIRVVNGHRDQND